MHFRMSLLRLKLLQPIGRFLSWQGRCFGQLFLRRCRRLQIPQPTQICTVRGVFGFRPRFTCWNRNSCRQVFGRCGGKTVICRLREGRCLLEPIGQFILPVPLITRCRAFGLRTARFIYRRFLLPPMPKFYPLDLAFLSNRFFLLCRRTGYVRHPVGRFFVVISCLGLETCQQVWTRGHRVVFFFLVGLGCLLCSGVARMLPSITQPLRQEGFKFGCYLLGRYLARLDGEASRLRSMDIVRPGLEAAYLALAGRRSDDDARPTTEEVIDELVA